LADMKSANAASHNTYAQPDSKNFRLRACLRRGFRRGGKRDSWGVGQQDDTRCDDDAEPTRPT